MLQKEQAMNPADVHLPKSQRIVPAEHSTGLARPQMIQNILAQISAAFTQHLLQETLAFIFPCLYAMMVIGDLAADAFGGE